MAAGAVAGFLKSIVPGLKNLGSMAVRAGRSGAANFRHARNVGVGTRLTNAAGAGRTAVARNWAQLGAEGQRSVRNAGIALGAGAGLLAVNRGGAEARGA